MAGSAASPKTTQGINARRRRAAPTDSSTIHATVPFRAAMPNRYVTPVSSTNRSTGKPEYISRGASRTTNVPTRNVMTMERTPRLIGRTVPTMKMRTSPAIPIVWTDRWQMVRGRDFFHRFPQLGDGGRFDLRHRAVETCGKKSRPLYRCPMVSELGVNCFEPARLPPHSFSPGTGS